MSKEFLPGLEIPNTVRVNPDINSWLRTWADDEINKHSIAQVIIGLTGAHEGYYPVELDLRNPNGIKTIFIVGRPEKTLKTHMMIGIAKRASDTIAPHHLRINLLADENDPDGITKAFWFKKHGEKSSVFAGSPATGKIIENTVNVLAKTSPKNFQLVDKNPDPDFLLIQNLGRFFSVMGNPNIPNLRSILSYKGPSPHLTIATVKHDDVEMLERMDISKEKTNAIWLFEADYPGLFHEWNQKKKALTEIPIIGFEI